MKQLISDDMIKKMYQHWTYGFACLYCFIGLLTGGFLLIQSASDSGWPFEFHIGMAVLIGALLSGRYISHVGDRNQEIFNREFEIMRKKAWNGRPEYWQLTERIKQFWNESKYIPNDFAMLKKKQIKESAIFEYSIQELNEICTSVKQRIAQ